MANSSPGFGWHTIAHLYGDAASPLLNGAGAVTGINTLTNVGHAIGSPTATLSNPSGVFTKAPAFTQGPAPSSGGSSSGAKTDASQTGSIPPTTTADPNAYGGYGSAAAQSAANNAYNTYKGYANNDLSKLLDSYNADTAKINSNYDTQGNELQSGYNAAQAQNQQAVTQQHKDLLDQQNSIRQGVHQAYQNALNILGALGAGGSSAALNWAPNAASDFQNVQVGNANKNTAANLASLASNWNTYDQGFENQKKKLADARAQDLANEQAAFDQTKTTLGRIIDAINNQNMTPSDVATGLNGVEGNINNDHFVKPSYTGVTPVFATPQLSSFEAPGLQTNLTTAVPDNSAATPAAVYLATLQNQKKQQQPTA